MIMSMQLIGRVVLGCGYVVVIWITHPKVVQTINALLLATEVYVKVQPRPPAGPGTQTQYHVRYSCPCLSYFEDTPHATRPLRANAT